MSILDFDEGSNSDPSSDDVHYGFGPDNFKHAIVSAEGMGMTVIIGQPDTLLLDLDEDMELNERVLKTIEEHLGAPVVESWLSKSGNKHMTLQFPGQSFTPLEALLLEVSIGSDPWRGFLSMMDMRYGVENPRTLFKPGSK